MTAINTGLTDVMVYCPTYKNADGSLAVYERTRESLEALEWDGWIDIVYGTSNPYPHDQKGGNVLENYRKGRAMCLDGDFSALLTVEHDMVIPADALAKMGGINKPVVYAVYVMRHGSPRINAWSMSRETNSRAICQHPKELKEAIRNQVHPVSGVGFGCTLFRRDILERFPFRGDDSRYGDAPDRPFAMDLEEAGVQQYAHFGVACGHILPTGEVLWPEWVTDKQSEVDIVVNTNGVYMALESFAGQVGMRKLQFIKGDYYELDQYRAASYVREGLLGRVDVQKVEAIEAPKPKIEEKRRQVKAKPKAKKVEEEPEEPDEEGE